MGVAIRPDAIYESTLRNVSVKRVIPKRRKSYRDNARGLAQCWRLTQKYNRYMRTGARIGTCQTVGAPDEYCPQFGKAAFRVGTLGRNRACTACGRYWIS
jgi:hypothetical protein